MYKRLARVVEDAIVLLTVFFFFGCAVAYVFLWVAIPVFLLGFLVKMLFW